MNKADRMTEIFKRRISSGYYDNLIPLPSGRQLAKEMGISYLTARKVLQYTLDAGLLKKKKTGELEINTGLTGKNLLKVAYCCPAFPSSSLFTMFHQIEKVVEKRGTMFLVPYTNPDDPNIYKTISNDNFDCVFLSFTGMESSIHHLKELLKQARNKTIILFNDWVKDGFFCMDATPSSAISELMQHLYGLGHRKISCMNTQAKGNIIQDRIRMWESSLKSIGATGNYYESLIKPFMNPATLAYELTKEMLKKGDLDDTTALFCTTVHVAKGVNRALFEQGVKVGEDISICSFGEPEEAALMTPSLTTVYSDNSSSQIEAALDWIESGGTATPTHVLSSEEVKIFHGESTGKLRKQLQKIK